MSDFSEETSICSKSWEELSIGSNAESIINSRIDALEDICVDDVHEMLKNATQAFMHTMNFSQATDKHFNNVNLGLAQIVSEQLSQIQQIQNSLMSYLASVQDVGNLHPLVLMGLLNRYKIVEEKLLLRQVSLQALLTSANEYLLKSNIGETIETMKETHNRYLILQKNINVSDDLEVKLKLVGNLLEKFTALPNYGDNQDIAVDCYTVALERLEREETIGDALRQIQHVCDLIKKSKAEPGPSEISNTNWDDYTDYERSLIEYE